MWISRKYLKIVLLKTELLISLLSKTFPPHLLHLSKWYNHPSVDVIWGLRNHSWCLLPSPPTTYQSMNCLFYFQNISQIVFHLIISPFHHPSQATSIFHCKSLLTGLLSLSSRLLSSILHVEPNLSFKYINLIKYPTCVGLFSGFSLYSE